MEPGKVTALIGPSGCGKSTLLRCLNRMNDMLGNVQVGGCIQLDGEDIAAPGSDPVEVRNAIVAHLTEGEVDPAAAVSLLMAAKYLERMGDHAENVADWTGFLEG